MPSKFPSERFLLGNDVRNSEYSGSRDSLPYAELGIRGTTIHAIMRVHGYLRSKIGLNANSGSIHAAS